MVLLTTPLATEKHELGDAMLHAVNQYLESRGIRITTGRLWM